MRGKIDNGTLLRGFHNLGNVFATDGDVLVDALPDLTEEPAHATDNLLVLGREHGGDDTLRALLNELCGGNSVGLLLRGSVLRQLISLARHGLANFSRFKNIMDDSIGRTSLRVALAATLINDGLCGDEEIVG